MAPLKSGRFAYRMIAVLGILMVVGIYHYWFDLKDSIPFWPLSREINSCEGSTEFKPELNHFAGFSDVDYAKINIGSNQAKTVSLERGGDNINLDVEEIGPYISGNSILLPPNTPLVIAVQSMNYNSRNSKVTVQSHCVSNALLINKDWSPVAIMFKKEQSGVWTAQLPIQEKPVDIEINNPYYFSDEKKLKAQLSNYLADEKKLKAQLSNYLADDKKLKQLAQIVNRERKLVLQIVSQDGKSCPKDITFDDKPLAIKTAFVDEFSCKFRLDSTNKIGLKIEPESGFIFPDTFSLVLGVKLAGNQ